MGEAAEADDGAAEAKGGAPADPGGVSVRATLGWGVAATGVLFLAYLGTRLYGEVRETRRIIPKIDYRQETVAKFGGPERLARRLAFYLRVPGEESGLRYAAVSRLGYCGRHGVPALIRALQDKDKTVRTTAAQALCAGGAEVPETAVPALVVALADVEPSVRGNAASSLSSLARHGQARLFVARAAPALVKTLGDRSDAWPSPYNEACSALRGLGREAVPALRGGLRDADRRIRIASVCLLMDTWNWGSAGTDVPLDAVPVLIEGLADQSVNVRQTHASYLARFGPKAHDAVPALLAIMNDPDFDVRNRATEALSAIEPGSRRSVAALFDQLASDNLFGESGFRALDRIGPEAVEAVPLLVELLKHRKPRVRRNAARILVRMGQHPQEVIPVFVEEIREGDEGSNWSPLYDLAKIGPPAVPALLELLNDQNLSVRKRGAQGLSALGPAAAEAVPVLAKLLGNDGDLGREYVPRALGSIGPAALPVLLEALASPKAALREGALYGLGEMKSAPREALPALLSAARHQDPKTLRWARWLVAKIAPEDERVTALLLKALEDSDREVRWQAAYILGGPEFKAPAIPAALKRVLADPDAGVRQAVAVSFWKHTGNQEETVPVLVTDLSSPDRGTRWHAAEALGQVGKGSPAAVAALIRYVKEEPARDELGRKEPHMNNSLVGIRSLGRVDQGSPEVLELLISLLAKGRAYNVRHTAAEALGDIGPPAAAALDALKKTAQEDKDTQLRQRASEAVYKIRAPVRGTDGKR